MIVCCRKSAFLKIIWRKRAPISEKFLLSFGQKKFVMHQRFRSVGVQAYLIFPHIHMTAATLTVFSYYNNDQ